MSGSVGDGEWQQLPLLSRSPPLWLSMLRKQFIILIAYTLVALVMTYPLGLNFATAIPGVEGDAPSFVWALGWMKTALIDLRANPFYTDYVFYPLGGATQVLWAVSLLAFISIPLQYAFGLIVTHNLLYLAATVLTAWGTYLLAEEVLHRSDISAQRSGFDARTLPPFQTFLLFKFVTEQRRLAARRSPLAPFAAGLVFAFAPLRLGYGIAFFNLFNTQLIPFYALFLIRARRDASPREAVRAGIVLGLNAYIDFQIAAFLVLFTALYVLYAWVADRPARGEGSRALLARLRASLPATIQTAALSALVALLVVAPLLALLANDFAREGGNYIRVFPLKYSAERSYDLLAFFIPNARSTVYAAAPLKVAGINAPLNSGDDSARSPDRQAFVGYSTLALAAYATARQWRRARFWFFAALVFALCALGPTLHLGGRDWGIPLPYLALHQIPIVNHIRIPMRYGIVVMFALAVLVALAIDDLQKRFSSFRFSLADTRRGFAFYIWRFALLLLPCLILLEAAAWPYPLQPVTFPRVYEQLTRAPGDFTILEIPTFNWRHAARAELYQAIHGKRILRAYTNRIAPSLAEYFGTRGIPIVVRSLRALEGAQPDALTAEEIAEDARARDEVVRFYALRYAILHRDWLTPDRARALDAYLREVLAARVFADEGDVVAYEIPGAPNVSEVTRVDLRELMGQMYAGRGWQFEYPPANWQGQFNFVWARGAESEIYFVVEHAAARTLTFHARAESPQRVVVWLNDTRLGELALTSAWQDHHVTVPAPAQRVGMNRVRLQYAAELREAIGVTTIVIR